MEAMWAAAGGGTSEGAAAGVAEGAESESAAGAEEEDEDYLAQMEAMWANVPMVEAPPPSPSPTPPLTPPIEGRRRDGGEVEAPHDAIALPSDAEEEGEQGDEAEFADEYFYDKYEQDFY